MYKGKHIINNIVIIIGIVASIATYSISLGITEYYKLVFLIPCVYTIMFAISTNNKMIFDNIGILILNIVMFIRYLLYPLIIVSTFKSGSYLGISQFINTSIYLMVYECIAVFLMLNWWGGRRLGKSKINYKRKLGLYTKFDLIVVITLVIFVIAILLHPSLLSKYNFARDTNVEKENVSGFLGVFFRIGFYMIFVFIVGIIYKTHKKTGSSIALFFTIIISLFLIASESNKTSGDVSRWGFLIFSLSILLIITKLYNNYSRWIWGLSVPAIFVSIVTLTIIKFGDDFTIQTFILKYFSTLSLDYYFMGIENISYGLATIKAFDPNITLYTMLTDMFSAVPLVSNFFDPANNSTPVFYHDFMGRTDTIIPTIAQSYSYFGFIGAPFMSILFTFLTIEANRMLNRSKDIMMNFVLSQQTILFALFMAINTNIIFESTWYRLIFIIIIVLNNKYPFFRANDTNQQIIRIKSNGKIKYYRTGL